MTNKLIARLARPTIGRKFTLLFAVILLVVLASGVTIDRRLALPRPRGARGARAQRRADHLAPDARRQPSRRRHSAAARFPQAGNRGARRGLGPLQRRCEA